MPDLFHSPRLTLARAQHHIRDFNQIVQEFVNSKPCVYFVDKQTQPGQDLHKVQFTSDPPDMLPCVLFDATNNLRAVLDQAGYASAVSANSPSLKAVKFPFGPTLQDWRNNVTGDCKDLPLEIRAIFEAAKSYKGGNNTLWAVNEVANAKKHQALRPVVVSTPSAFFKAQSIGPGGLDEVTSPGGFGIGWKPEKREITLWSAPAATRTDLDLNLTFSIVIDGVDVIAGQQAAIFLNSAYDEVGRVLLETEAECRRLGLL
jgi:hypothetical protein